MIGAPQAWKLLLALGLLAAIFLSAYGRAPRQLVGRGKLRRLVVSAVCLYAAGVFASITHHGALAAIVYGAGIGVCALAVWLSRGIDPGDPPDGRDEPGGEQPPPGPRGIPAFDWTAFEFQFRSYADREREPMSR